MCAQDVLIVIRDNEFNKIHFYSSHDQAVFTPQQLNQLCDNSGAGETQQQEVEPNFNTKVYHYNDEDYNALKIDREPKGNINLDDSDEQANG